MPLLGPVVVGVIGSLVPWLISKVFKAIGLAFVTYVGMSVGIDQAEQYIFANFNNLGTEVYQILSIAGFPTGIKILFSAFGAALILKNAATGGTTTKTVWNRPGPFQA